MKRIWIMLMALLPTAAVPRAAAVGRGYLDVSNGTALGLALANPNVDEIIRSGVQSNKKKRCFTITLVM